jgi:hypothetical protein
LLDITVTKNGTVFLAAANTSRSVFGPAIELWDIVKAHFTNICGCKSTLQLLCSQWSPHLALHPPWPLFSL